jgi:hypothetical protein
VNLPANYDSLNAAQRRAVRELYVEQQEGKCYYCSELLSVKAPERITELSVDWTLFPPFFLKHPVHLQHNHVTGMTEGAVHAYCNAVMWQYEGR